MEISAVIRFLRREQGGRGTPIFSGYRPTFYFGEEPSDGAVILEGTNKATPGEERRVKIQLLHPEHLNGKPQQGERFEVREGRRVVGEGYILSPEWIE